MPDHAAVGFWVRRFLSDHLMHERGVSRNTQQSYRDTFCLFLPFAAERLKTAIDKLVIDDLSPSIVSGFLAHLEQARSCSVAQGIRGLLPSTPSPASQASRAQNTWSGAHRFVIFPLSKRGRLRSRIWKKMRSTNFFAPQTGRLSTARETTLCFCFSTTQAHAPARPREL